MIKIWLLLSVALFALCVGSVCFGDEQAVLIFAHTGYWFVALNFFLLLFCLFKVCQGRVRCIFTSVDRSACLIAGGVLVLSVLFVSRSEPMGFKTIMDEHMIAATARGMHLERQAALSQRLHYVYGQPVSMNPRVDKRPVFFPYLVSLVHDLFGYHPENSIRLNVYVLCPLLFVLLYILGSRLGGAWGGGLLCVLVATIPLCGFIFNGGGLELLNLVMLILCMLLALDFWENPNAFNCGALCFATTLLAQTRYESVIFVLPVVLIFGLSWWRVRRIEVYWPLFVTPLLLIPYLWQNRIFRVDVAHWQLEGQARPFGVEYLPDNWVRSICYYFNVDTTVPNSWILPVLSLVAAVFLLLRLVRFVRERGAFLDNKNVPWILYFSGYIALYLLLLCYSWEFGGVIVQRLCLPLYLPMALLVLAVFREFLAQRRGVLVAGGSLLAIYIVGYAYPVSSYRQYDMGIAYKEYEVIREILESGELDKDSIFISDNASFYVVYGYACADNRLANLNKQGIVNYLAQPNAKTIYSVFGLSYTGNPQKYVDHSFSQLDADFIAKPVLDRWLSPTRRVIFHQVTGIEGYQPQLFQYESPEVYRAHWMRMLP